MGKSLTIMNIIILGELYGEDFLCDKIITKDRNITNLRI